MPVLTRSMSGSGWLFTTWEKKRNNKRKQKKKENKTHVESPQIVPFVKKQQYLKKKTKQQVRGDTCGELLPFFCCIVHCSVDAFDPWVWVQTFSSFLALLERFVEGVAWESLHLKGYKKKATCFSVSLKPRMNEEKKKKLEMRRTIITKKQRKTTRGYTMLEF